MNKEKLFKILLLTLPWYCSLNAAMSPGAAMAPKLVTDITNTPEFPAIGALTLFNKDLLNEAPTSFGSFPKPVIFVEA